MAVVQKNITTQSTSSTTTAATFTGAQTAGNINIIAVGYFGGTSGLNLSSLTDSKGNVYQLIEGGGLFIASNGPFYLYWCPSIAAASAGTNTVTATWSAAATFTEIQIYEYPAITNPVIRGFTWASAAQASPLQIGPITLNSGDLVFCLFRGNVATTYTPTNLTVQEGSGSTYMYGCDDSAFSGSFKWAQFTPGASSSMMMYMVGIGSQTPNSTYTGPTVVQANFANQSAGQASISCAFTSANTAGNTLLAAVYSGNSTSNMYQNGITDTLGNKWKFVCWASTTFQIEVFACENCLAGSNTLSLVWNGTPATNQAMQIVEIAGSKSLDTCNQATGSGLIGSGNACALAGNNELLVSFIWSGAVGTPTVSGSGTMIQTTGAFDAAASYLQVKTQSAASLYFNVPNGSWAAAIVALSASPYPTNSLAQAQVPIMGWDSWRTYGNGVNATDANMRSQSNALLSTGLQALGYKYFNVNDTMYNGRSGNNLTVNSTLFPNGDTAFWNFIKGNNQVPAYYLGMGIGCCGFPNSETFESFDAALANTQGAKYLMFDSCRDFQDNSSAQAAATAMGNYLASDGIAFCISTPAYESGAGVSVWGPRAGGSYILYQPDVVGGCAPAAVTWAQTLSIINNAIVQSAWSRPGRLNMTEYLPTGNGTLTDAEGRTAMAMWCMLNTPIFLAANLTTISANSLATVSNTELIAINQDALGVAAYLYSNSGGNMIWARPISGGKWAVTMLNTNSTNQNITVNWSMFGQFGPFNVRDLWAHSNLGTMSTGYSTTVASHDNATLLLTPLASTMAATRFGNPTAGTVSFSNDECLQILEALTQLLQKTDAGVWWYTTPQTLQAELVTEVVTNRSLAPISGDF